MVWFSTAAPKCRRAHIHICYSSSVCVRRDCVCVGSHSYHTHVATRTCTYIYMFPSQVVGGSDVATRLFKYIAMCAIMCLIPIHITHFSLCHNHYLVLCHNRCVAITLWRCVAFAMFPFVVSQSLFGVVTQSPCFSYLFVVSQSLFPVVSQSLFGVVAHIPYARRCLYT